jgi:surface protein
MLGTESPLLGDAETQPSDCSQCYEQDMKTNGCIFNTACYQSGTWDKTVCDRVNGKLCPSIATDNLPLNINYEINYEIHNIVLSYNIDSPEYPYDKTKNIRDKYGPIEYWDVSSITAMYSLFISTTWFNTDISSWNVSSVTDMNNMFNLAFAFNQPLDSWNVSSVTDMSFMFSEATNFNQDISGWDVSNVTNMNMMFYGATTFNQDISGWDINEAVTKGITYQGFYYPHWNFGDFATGSPLLQNKEFLPKKLQPFF